MGSARTRGLLLVLVVGIGALGAFLLTRPTRDVEPTLEPAAERPAGEAPAPTDLTPAPTPPPAPEDPDLGRRLFREACAWVAGGEPDIVAVADMELSLTLRAEVPEPPPDEAAPPLGTQRVWLRGLDQARWDTDLGQGLTSRVLVRNELHERAASGRFRNAKRENDGAERLRRAQAERQRWIDLGTFVTLAGLDLPDATFTFEGEKTAAEGAAAPASGRWAQVTRVRKGEREISFWFATEGRRDRALHVTYPGWVRIAGNLSEGEPAQDFLLGGWQSSPGRTRRLPTTLRILEVGSGKPARTLLDATVTDFRINADVDSQLFDTH